MADRRMPAVGKVISGTHGYLWWEGELCFEVTSFEATVSTNRETINFAGQMWDDSKLMGVSGSWSATIKKIYSRGKALAEELSKGHDKRIDLVVKLEDPDNGGIERIQLNSCWVDELALQKFEHGSIVEDEFSGGFTGFKYLDTIADPCN